MQNTVGPDTASNVKNRIRSVQNRLLDKVLAAATIYFAVLSAIVQFKIIAGQFPILKYTLFTFFLALTTVFLCRNKIKYHIKLSILLVLVNAFAIVNLYNFGLIGGGRNFMMFSILFTSVFATRKATVGVFIISTMILLAFMFPFVSGDLELSFDIGKYTKNYYSWITQISSFAIIIGILVLVTSGLFKNIQELAIESSNHVKQISLLNKGLEDKVALRTRELEEVNKSKDIILAIVAHDIKNHLAGIIGSLDLLTMSDSPPDEQEKKTYTTLAKDVSMQTLDIVTDLLEYAKIESGELELQKEKVNIHSLITANIHALRQQAAQKDITVIDSRITETLYCTINYNKIFRVIDNLLQNAIKFTPNGGTISAEAGQQEDTIVIAVTDSGIGIPDELKEHLFSPFSKSGRQGTSNEPTTGLGLTICKRLIELHNGRIWLESSEGKGTTFFVQLPKGT